MSTSGGKWETVSHKKKATVADKRAAQKALVQNAPTVDQMSPLQQSATMFSEAFTNGSAKGTKKANGDASHSSKKPNQPTQQQKKKKGSSDGKKKPERFNTLDEALDALHVSEVKGQLDDVKERVPDSPALWLGDLALLLNRKLLTKELDPTFPDKPSDYPLCKMSSSVRNLLKTLMDTYPERMLSMFFQHCIREIENDLPKGNAVNGYRIFLQLLAVDYPHFVTNRISDYLEVLKRRQSDRATCLTILWGCIQAGHHDPVIGLQVWSKLMLPLLGHKMISPYAISTLDWFLGQKLDEKRASQVLGPNEFFPILDYVFTPNNSLQPNLQKQLFGHYPRLKSLAFQENPESNLRNFFPSLLARTTDHCPVALKTELLECLVYCLCHDQHCFSEWRQMYDSHMKQSSVLMNHIIKVWDQVKLPKKLLQETVRAFSVTNEEQLSLTQASIRRIHIEQCKAACEELLEKMSSFRMPWKTMISVVFLSIMTFLVLDLFTSNGFSGSRTETFLQKSGLLAVTKHAWAKISLFSTNVMGWLHVNTPIYYAKIKELCGPYLTLALEKIYDIWAWFVTMVTPFKEWIAENAPIWLDWFLAQTVEILQLLMVWLTILWEVVSDYAIAGWIVVAPYMQQAWDVTIVYMALVWEAMYPVLDQTWIMIKTMFSKT
ncbi:transmembrane protein 214-A-like [Lytechinus variegatus]|uniref:transmembrane protein 214-A-like n=1 Tax=Lytechinus variegatus TaxID=7654 RepID=UPI001BB2C155|nr:transmembrane protein 214-A-like [Lytechinus variegatus]